MTIHTKKLLYLLLFIFGFTDLFAQQNPSSVKLPELSLSKNSQRMFEEALKEVVFCMRQEYVIQNRKGERFGRKNEPFFGKTYSIGVIVENELYFPSYLRKPWVGDENLLEYKKTHKPVCSNLYIKNVTGGLERELANLQIDTSYTIASFKQGPYGLAFSKAEDKSKGYLMLYHIPEDTEEVFPEITVSLHQLTDIIWDGNNSAKVKKYQFLGKEAIGGVYLMEDISIGRIELKVGGLYIKEGDEWILKSVLAQNKL